MEDPYTIRDHLNGRRPQAAKDRSWYSQVRLTVTAGRRNQGLVSVVVRTVGGGYVTDARIAAGFIDLTPGSDTHRFPLAALEAGLRALTPSQRAMLREPAASGNHDEVVSESPGWGITGGES